MMTNIFRLVLFSSILISCSAKKGKIHELQRLNGEWTTIFHGETISEKWELQGDTMWVGNTSLLRDGQSFMTEEMNIQLKDGKFVFCTSVKDQNEGLEVKFTLKEHSGNRLVFENLKHDFPQLITYDLKNDKELNAYISGTNQGEKIRMDFNYKRVK